jgi:peptide-methionine (R)-S-oxide reductase
MKNRNKILYLILPVTFIAMMCACSVNSGKRIPAKKIESVSVKLDSVEAMNMTEQDWKRILTPDQYQVLREKATDKPFTGKYYLNTEKGLYACAACGNELFTSDMKFESACGWPSFDKSVEGGKIKTVEDTTHGMIRTEILCGRCGSHLGHLFDDGPTLTGKRYCVNSTSLNFKSEATN